MSVARPKIMVSACLLGRLVRYDGKAKTLAHPALARWEGEGRVVPICPELVAGFGVPRPPAEIAGGRSGRDVLRGEGRVVEKTGGDVTDLYIAGAEAALALARDTGCAYALLTDRSPSCGSASIYGGGFDGVRHANAGVTAALLRANGIHVFAETEADALEVRLLADEERRGADPPP